ncbi:MAG: putative bifunctional diguanylate cyclase/phosphodiesterase, partial [Gaiellales bacterium]
SRDLEDAYEALEASEVRFRSLVQNSSDVIAVVGIDTAIGYQTPSIRSVLGYEPEALAGTKFSEIVHRDDAGRTTAFLSAAARREGLAGSIESRVRHDDGSWKHVEIIASNLTGNSTIEGIVLTIRDITERKLLEEQLTYQAFHDSLTGLANRALFADRVGHAFARRHGRGEIAVLFLDLDDFKTVNDGLGHAAGDELLVELAARLNASVRAGDTCARLGGDEFAILLECVPDLGYATEVAERILGSLEAPFSLNETEVFARASVGIAMPTGRDDRAEELLRNADAAMYRARSRGAGGYQVFEPSMHLAAVERLELKGELGRALERSEFVLHYQPIVSLEDGAITAAEALLRWQHPRRGLLLPGDFIDLAEETGLIVPLGQWVLEQACRQLRSWREEHHGAPPELSVNLSGRQLSEPALADDVAKILQRHQLQPHALTLEITESALVEDTPTAIRRLRQLKQLGVTLAIDDFGTGYSSLSYLQSFPLDVLKIPKPFIDDIVASTNDTSLAGAIVNLGGTLELDTVAEGVETADQLDQLERLDCPRAQGDYFAKALPPSAFTRLLKTGLSSHKTNPPEQHQDRPARQRRAA